MEFELAYCKNARISAHCESLSVIHFISPLINLTVFLQKLCYSVCSFSPHTGDGITIAFTRLQAEEDETHKVGNSSSCAVSAYPLTAFI